MTKSVREILFANSPQNQIATFLTTYPLYRKYKYKFDISKELESPDTLRLTCTRCGPRSVFDYKDKSVLQEIIHIHQPLPAVHHPSKTTREWWETLISIRYHCHVCKFDERFYAISIDRKNKAIWKVGQHPPYSIDISPLLESALGDDTLYYKNALVCMSQSYGLGACAYLRRVIENKMHDILVRLRDSLQAEHADSATLQKIDVALQSNVAADKAKIAAEVCPSYLRPGDTNPFRLFHNELSTGIHIEDEHECMDLATEISATLQHVIIAIAENSQRNDEYLAKLKKVQDRRSKRGKSEG